MISSNYGDDSLCESETDSSVHYGIEEGRRKKVNNIQTDIVTIEENSKPLCNEMYDPKFDDGGMSTSNLNAEGSDAEITKINKHDNFSIASFSSASSSSSSLSSVGLTVESVKRVSSLLANQNNLKSLEVLNNNSNIINNSNNNNINNNNNNNSNNNNNDNTFQPAVHNRIRRVPSTANPKYRVPNLQKNQRSKSQPHALNYLLNQQRRNSSPSINGKPIPNKYQKSIQQASSMPNFSNIYPQSQPPEPQTQKPQQIIYLQIPQPSKAQLSDPQGLQQQISSQLQLLVPQIYNQLVNQIVSSSKDLSTINMNINQKQAKEPVEEPGYLNKSQESVYSMEENHTEELNAQTQHNSFTKNSSHQQPGFLTNSEIKKLVAENFSDNRKIAELIDINQLLQQLPLEGQKTTSNSESSYIEIKQFPGTPKIVIPLTEELILQCQQLQQFKESNFAPYQPKLETILEESLSVKHLKIERFSKTKVVACILTVLCVIVVVLLAGDKTIAVAVVASVFILFLLGSSFYLYTHSAKREIETAFQRSENPRLQISDFANRSNPSLV